MGNFYEDMFTGNNKKKKSSSKSKSYDWMQEAVSSNSMNNPAMGGIDIDSIIKGSSKSKKKSSNPNDYNDIISGMNATVKGTEVIVKGVKVAVSRANPNSEYNLKKTISKAKEIERKEKLAKEAQEAREKIAEFETRKAEYEARRKEDEPQKQSVFARLRNLRRNNGTPDHVKPKTGNS